MKKAIKTEKTTTPAQPAPVPVKKTAAKSTSAKSAAAPTVAKPVVVKAAPVSVAKEAAPAATPKPKAHPTTISAQIDVGFGNTLYVRGEGPGLSWETGVPLDCVADDKWTISFSEAAKPVVFKFLINDETWCLGDDFVATPGATITVAPAFLPS